jgi:Fe-Mn family superoxide dismutase
MHSIFWRNLAPQAGGRPSGELAQAIDQSFGSFDNFRQQLTKTAASIQGSGWAALQWEPLSQQLLVSQIHDHQSMTLQGATPLMVLDAWEHAWYLQYLNEKAKFFEAVWNLWNWNDVAQRLSEARRTSLAVKKVSERV